jgi:hypothetical protein
MNTGKKAIAFLQKMEEVKKAKANKQKQKSVVVELKPKIILTQELRTNFPYICDHCKGYICYHTLFINDMTGRYIALDRDTMRPHRCKITKKLEEIDT